VDQIVVEIKSKKIATGSLRIFDLAGREILTIFKSRKISPQNPVIEKIDLSAKSGFASGSYLLKWESQSGAGAKRILIQR
jgi:hypothetical protein